jgi:hypothetical protein
MSGVMNRRSLVEYLFDSGVRQNHSYGATLPITKASLGSGVVVMKVLEPQKGS